jgi:hypothetical protein
VLRPFIVVAVALLVTACGEGESTVDSPVATTLPSSPETTMPTDQSTPDPSEATTPTSVPSEGTDGVPASLLEPVLEDAAARAGVDVDGVAVVSTEFRDWPDSALGCPVPGMMYTQVITPGYRIVVEAGGQQYDYRMNRRGSFRLCENPGAIPDIRTPSTVIPGTTSPDT